MQGRMRGRMAALAVVSALAMAACSSSVVRTSGSSGSAPQGATSPVRVSQPKYGATQVVKKGDTVYRIATTNGITALDLALWNNIPPPYIIHPGQRLRLYPGGSVATIPPPRTPVKPATTRPSTPPPSVVAPVANLAWRWPAEGALISTYQVGNPTRQGIDIAGNAGEPVRAAADGTVVYSGSGLVGYGELIIVKHNDQWLSAYGHNRKRLVSEGAVVKVGQQIGELGSTGTSRNMLHFEIRLNGKPVDPLQYLPRK
ncbi:MAG: peptidoglycan DD-metalloendopeptidase family protein [Xanthomonadaceae bacterium]|nr:peptidoglycan DD-metalloendopeptidase family protein [Xanthomonadaceae bacterium]